MSIPELANTIPVSPHTVMSYSCLTAMRSQQSCQANLGSCSSQRIHQAPQICVARLCVKSCDRHLAQQALLVTQGHIVGIPDLILSTGKLKLARHKSCFVTVQVQWDRTMRRVIMMEADVSDGSTPLLDTFADIAEGQNKVTIAQVKVCSTSQRLPAGVHCTAAIIDLSATMIRIRLIFIAWPAASFTILIIEGEY